MNFAQKRADWNFWIWWVGLTIIGGLAGNFVADKFGLAMLNWPTDVGILLSMLGSGVFALFVSTGQWFLLRRLFNKAGWWVASGTLGRAFGMLIGSIFLVIITSQLKLQAGLWSTSMYLATRGAVLGVSQWLIFRQWRTKTGWWVLGNAIGWMLGPTLLDLFIPSIATSAPLISDLLDIAIAAGITGAVMVWILRQPIPAATKKTGEDGLIVTWISVWAISWGISWVVGWSIVRYIIGSGFIVESGQIGGRIAGVIAGLIGGVGTAIVLKLAKPSNSLRIYHLVLLAAGWGSIVFYDWLDGFAVAGLSGTQNKYGLVVPTLSAHQINHGTGGLLSGLVGGILTAAILLWLIRSLNWKQLGVIVTGWVLGFAIGGWIAWTIGFPIALNYVYGPVYGNDPGSSSLILFALISILCGAFAGWSGGVATLRQLSREPVPK